MNTTITFGFSAEVAFESPIESTHQTAYIAIHPLITNTCPYFWFDI